MFYLKISKVITNFEIIRKKTRATKILMHRAPIKNIKRPINNNLMHVNVA